MLITRVHKTYHVEIERREAAKMFFLSLLAFWIGLGVMVSMLMFAWTREMAAVESKVLATRIVIDQAAHDARNCALTTDVLLEGRTKK